MRVSALLQCFGQHRLRHDGLLIPPSNVLIVFAFGKPGRRLGRSTIYGRLSAGHSGWSRTDGKVVAVIARRKQFPRDERVPLSQLWRDFRRSFLSLMLLVVIVGGSLPAFYRYRSRRYGRLVLGILAFELQSRFFPGFSFYLPGKCKTTV